MKKNDPILNNQQVSNMDVYIYLIDISNELFYFCRIPMCSETGAL
mgnify:CR=1 FL=1